jgi:hypothetical protein
VLTSLYSSILVGLVSSATWFEWSFEDCSLCHDKLVPVDA